MRTQIAFEHPPHRKAQRRHPRFPPRLDLDQHRHPARDAVEQLAQAGDAIVTARKPDRCQLRRAAICNRPALRSQPVELPVMKHHRLTVGRALDIAFDAHAPRQCGGESRRRILRRAGAMQAPVGIVLRADPADPLGIGGRRQTGVKRGEQRQWHRPRPPRPAAAPARRPRCGHAFRHRRTPPPSARMRRWRPLAAR